MTQKLILAVLLIGLVGLTWVMTIAILESDHLKTNHHEPESCHELTGRAGGSATEPVPSVHLC